ncbi:MAG TPA: NAD(P)H-dependent glycerol-3-phosphate dehydrogenase [Actinomycetales bacterium]|nr:NAD(P)H-dependent glycerol-3-phosphate dehydrogenase [Actinomycetales bacterium]
MNVSQPVRAAVLGTGSWGTTFAAVLADAGTQVTMWGRRAEVCEQITTSHRNEDYLPGTELPDTITATTDIAAALEGANLVVLALPAQSVAKILQEITDIWPENAIAVSLMKGVELGTHRRMSEVICHALGLPAEQIAVVSGPNLAREIASKHPTATVVASASQESAEFVARACANSYFRPYTNLDLVGVELCGAVKNVIALAVGVAAGMGFGDNTKATIITRGLAETTRLGLALGADLETFAGLAGMGDLVATCSSPLSRNYSLGMRVGQGRTLEEAIRETGQTAEGVKSSQSVLELAQSVAVDTPITEAIVGVLHRGLAVRDMAELLLARPRKQEGQ